MSTGMDTNNTASKQASQGAGDSSKQDITKETNTQIPNQNQMPNQNQIPGVIPGQ